MGHRLRFLKRPCFLLVSIVTGLWIHRSKFPLV
jgi:hypothetical protein